METKKAGDFEIPVLGIGTFGIGGEHEADYSKDKEAVKIIREAIKLGYNHIDTAESYGNRHSEEIIGKAIKEFDRKKLFITTKVSKEHLKYDDLINSCKNSLKRLNTDYIDLYLIHEPNPEIPLKETMKAMDYLVENNFIRHIGVSNFNIEQLKEAQKCTKNKIAANELKYNLWAKIDIKTIKYCQDNNIIVIAHKPFGRGMLFKEKISLLSELSKKYNRTEAQIILNWLISEKNTVAVFKSENLLHLKENLNFSDFQLSQEDIKRLSGRLNINKTSQ